MKRLLLLPAIGFALAGGGAGAELGCVDEGYDPLTGGSKRVVSRPEVGVLLPGEPERADPLWLDDPSRPPLATTP